MFPDQTFLFRSRRLQASLRNEGEGLEVVPGSPEVSPEVQAEGVDFERLEGGLEGGEEGAGGFGGDLVLDDDVGLEALAVLWGEVGGERCGEMGVKSVEGGGGEGVGYAFAEGAETGYGQEEGLSLGGEGG